jgi:hypothetical protein
MPSRPGTHPGGDDGGDGDGGVSSADETVSSGDEALNNEAEIAMMDPWLVERI